MDAQPHSVVLERASWWAQYAALCRKHATVARRNPLTTAAQLLMGVAVCVLIIGMQQVANVVLSFDIPHPPTIPVAAAPRCTPGAHSVRVDGAGAVHAGDCNTLLFAPVSPNTVRIMQRVANNSGLLYGVDIAPIPGTATGPPFDLTMVNATQTTASAASGNGTAQCITGTCSGLYPTPDCLPCDLVRDNATITAWLLNHPNSTQNAVWFFGAYADDLDTSFGIMYNVSVTIYPFFASAFTMETKVSLDRAILELATEDAYGVATSRSEQADGAAAAAAAAGAVSAVFNLTVATRAFPKPVPRLVGYDVFSANGGQWCFIVPMLTFFTLLTEIVGEKEGRLRVGMRQMGLRTTAFWASWSTYGLVMGLGSTLVLEAAGYAFGFTFFTNASTGATLLVFGAFNISMLALALLLSTLISTAKTAQTVGYSVILLGFVLQFILTSAYAGLVDLLYSNSIASWVRNVRFLLERYPGFNFSKGFYDISTLSSATIDTQEGKLVQGPGFFWSDMYVTRSRTFAGFDCTLPPPVESIYYQLINTAVFLVLAFYLDAVLPGPHGSPSHPLFFLGCRYRSHVDPQAEQAASASVSASMHADVAAEAVVAKNTVFPVPGETGTAADDASAVNGIVVRVARLRVVYRRGLSALLYALTGVDASSWTCGRRQASASTPRTGVAGSINAGGAGSSVTTSTTMKPRSGGNNSTASGDVLAVQDVSFTVRMHEIMALLGHNGAGKSSLIAAITGLFTATSGLGEVLGYDVGGQIDQVQRVMGVCPQHDILWPQLTARETLRLYAAIKGVRSDAVEAELTRVLRDVRLTFVEHALVGGYSGGMKRRLSIAIACLGRPKLIMLDEPTTGLDPVHRMKVWRLIQRLKETAGVLLTTHNMEEANALGSRVAIMAHGRVAALGTPLRLKNVYGKGYRVNIVMVDDSAATADTITAGVKRHAPDAALSLRDAANVAFTVPPASLASMPALLDWIHSVSQVAHDAAGSGTRQALPPPLVREYNVSGPTLESVFLSVSAAANFDLAAGSALDDEHDDAPPPPVATAAIDDDDVAARLLDEPDGIAAGTGKTRASRGPAKPATAAHRVVDGKTQARPTYSYRALYIKNCTLILRQRGLCLCQVVTPLMVLGLLVLLQFIIKVEAGATQSTLIPSLLLPLNMNQLYPMTTSIPINTDAGTQLASSADGQPATPASGTSVASIMAAWNQRSLSPAHSQLAATTSAQWWQQPEAATFGLQHLRALRAGAAASRCASPVAGATAVACNGGERSAVEVGLDILYSLLVEEAPTASKLPPIAAAGVSAAGASAPVAAPAVAASPSQRASTAPPAYPPGYNTDCVLFFLFTVSPDGSDGHDAASLAAAVGSNPQTNLPWPLPSPLPSAHNVTGANATGLLGAVATNWCQMRNHSVVSAPYFAPRTGLSQSAWTIDDELMHDLNLLNNVSSNLLDYQPPCAPPPPSMGLPRMPVAITGSRQLRRVSNVVAGEPVDGSPAPYDPSIEQWACPAYITPDGSVDFHSLLYPTFGSAAGSNAAAASSSSQLNMALSMTVQVNDLTTTGYHRPNNFTRLGLPEIPKWASAHLALTVDPAKVALADMLLRAYVKTAVLPPAPSAAAAPPDETDATNYNVRSRLSMPMPSIVAVGNLVEDQVTNLLQFVEIVGAILHPITLTLQLPLFVFLVALEKEERLVELQRAMGLNYSSYNIVTYTLNFALYSLVAGVFWAVGRGMRFAFFSDTSQGLLFLGFAGWGLALCSLATLLSAFLWSRKAATVAGYVVALFGSLFAILIAAGIYGNSMPYSTGMPMPSWLYCFPMFGLVRFIYLASFNCIAKQACYSNFDAAIAPGSELRGAILSMYACAAVYQIVGLYLDQVLPRRYGVRKPLLFFVDDIREYFRRRAAARSGGDDARSGAGQLFAHIGRWASLVAGRSIADVTAEYAAGEDDDITAERQRVQTEILPAVDSSGAKTPAPSAQVAPVAGEAAAGHYPIVLSHLRKEFQSSSSSSSSWTGLLSVLRCGCSRSGSTTDTGKRAAARESVLSLNAGPSMTVDGASMTSSLLTSSPEDAPNSKNAVQAVLAGGRHYELEQQICATALQTKVAVSDLSLAVRSDEVLAALGENGCGKSTTINMLTGILPPSGGRAIVGGWDVQTDSEKARRSIGICFQQDLVWHNLTVKEHLLFYSRVKGVPPAELRDHVQAAMEDVGLAAFSDRLAGDLSGGMKRRLSLAIALCGDSSTIVLDEVTTGLDPATKRRIWRIINAARAGRAVLLVTHDMAEVEVLADRIGIMTFGRMRCMGDQQHLKTRYGGGQVLQVNYAIAGAEPLRIGEGIIARVQGLLPGARVDGHMPGTISFIVPDAVAVAPATTTAAGAATGGLARTLPAGGARSAIAHVFDVMQTHATSIGVTDWGVGQTTLDTVFERIVRHYRGAPKQRTAVAAGAARHGDSDSE